MVSTGSFVLREAMPPLLDVLQEGGTVSPSVSQEIWESHHLSPPPPPPLPTPGYLPSSSEALQCPQDFTPAMPQTAKTTTFERPLW